MSPIVHEVWLGTSKDTDAGNGLREEGEQQDAYYPPRSLFRSTGKGDVAKFLVLLGEVRSYQWTAMSPFIDWMKLSWPSWYMA